MICKVRSHSNLLGSKKFEIRIEELFWNPQLNDRSWNES